MGKVEISRLFWNVKSNYWVRKSQPVCPTPYRAIWIPLNQNCFSFVCLKMRSYLCGGRGDTYTSTHSTSKLDAGELSASGCGRLTLASFEQQDGRTPEPVRTLLWRQKRCHCQESNTYPPAVQPPANNSILTLHLDHQSGLFSSNFPTKFFFPHLYYRYMRAKC